VQNRRVRRSRRATFARGAGFCSALALVLTTVANDAASAPSSRPVDPDAATPHMRAPGGQPPDDRRRWDGKWATDASSRRRVALGLTGLFASYRLGFLGRPARPIRGAGIGTDLDIEIYSPVGIRISASYTAHRLAHEYDDPDDAAPTLSARGGTLHTVDLGAAVVFAMDIGRVRPVLEAGLGGALIRTPIAAIDGQRGGACLSSGGCDVGLVCASGENICRQGFTPRAHAGGAIEIAVGDRWLIAAMIRYFALLSAPTVFPVYLQAGVRVGVRF